MKDEEDIHPVPLPQEVLDFVDEVRETIAENTGVDVKKIMFKGFIMHFDVEGKPITFQGMIVT